MKLREIESLLLSFGVEAPREESLLIIERVFGISSAMIMAEKEKEYSSPLLDSILKRRKSREPLQYIFGSWEFMGKEFYVSPDCLIPRPDTEILVEKSLGLLKKGADVADLCTGSGCIGLSLLMYGNVNSACLVDISKEALDVAKKNAKRHALENKCEFVLGDIRFCMPNKKFDLIASNPPYIPTAHIEALSEEVKKEPILALDGGEDGLDIIRFLISDGLSYLKENGHMLIEFGFDQGEIIDRLLKGKMDTGSIKNYEILKDYGGNSRVAVIKK